jgi:hypothetical protein
MSVMRSEGLENLIGKTVTGIFVSPCRTYLFFDTSDGAVGYEVDGDCCSKSWFADLLGVDALLGGMVARFEPIALPQDGQERTRQEVDAVYGYTIVTDNGYATLAFRCSSNGYYGGWMHPAQPEARNRCSEQITDDWSA